MARYESDFSGIGGGFGRPRGRDPNYRDGYQGMRMSGGRGRAAYGSHRMWRAEDLEDAGGFAGIHGGHPDRRQRGRDPQSGVHDPFNDPAFLRQFNAYGPHSQGPRRGYGHEMVRRDSYPAERSWSPPRLYRPGYTNRGITDAGYSEGWARGPMRGAR
jgi:hypothetical protein